MNIQYLPRLLQDVLIRKIFFYKKQHKTPRKPFWIASIILLSTAFLLSAWAEHLVPSREIIPVETIHETLDPQVSTGETLALFGAGILVLWILLAFLSLLARRANDIGIHGLWLLTPYGISHIMDMTHTAQHMLLTPSTVMLIAVMTFSLLPSNSLSQKQQKQQKQENNL